MAQISDTQGVGLSELPRGIFLTTHDIRDFGEHLTLLQLLIITYFSVAPLISVQCARVDQK